jgi:hypothetical protein
MTAWRSAAESGTFGMCGPSAMALPDSVQANKVARITAALSKTCLFIFSPDEVGGSLLID